MRFSALENQPGHSCEVPQMSPCSRMLEHFPDLWKPVSLWKGNSVASATDWLKGVR